MKMIDIWLDDERNPKDLNIIRDFGSKGTEYWAKNINEAKLIILTNNINSISFDNDLGEGQEEGYILANWIEEKAFNKEIPKMNWKVHSRNPVASKRIEQSMRNADRYWQK